MFTLPNQPLSIGKTLDAGFKLYAAGIKGVLALAFAAALVSQIPNIVIMLMAPEGVRPGRIPAGMIGPGFVLLIILLALASATFLGALLAYFGSLGEGRPMGIVEALGRGLRRLPALIGAGILYTLVISIGFVLLLIPGIILMVSLWFTMPAVVIDGEGPYRSLRRSHALVWRGHWWRVTVLITVPVVLVLVLSIVAQMLAGVGLALMQGSPMAIMLIASLLQIVVGSVVTPLVYAMTVAIYHDLKLRREGGDLEARIGQGAAAAAS